MSFNTPKERKKYFTFLKLTDMTSLFTLKDYTIKRKISTTACQVYSTEISIPSNQQRKTLEMMWCIDSSDCYLQV